MFTYTTREGQVWLLTPICRIVGRLIACWRNSDGVLVIVEENLLIP
jgi:hypothetical protein